MRRSLIATLLTTLACCSAFGATDAGALEYAHHVGVGSGGNYFGPFVTLYAAETIGYGSGIGCAGIRGVSGVVCESEPGAPRDRGAGDACQLRTVHPQPFDVHQLLQRLLLPVGRRSSRRAGARRSSARPRAAGAVPGVHRRRRRREPVPARTRGCARAGRARSASARSDAQCSRSSRPPATSSTMPRSSPAEPKHVRIDRPRSSDRDRRLSPAGAAPGAGSARSRQRAGDRDRRDRARRSARRPAGPRRPGRGRG